MAARQEHKQITDNEGNEHTYFVIQKPAMQGEVLKFQLIKMLGPTLGKFKQFTQNGKVNEADALAIFGDAIQSLFEHSDPEQTVKWLQGLVIGITRDGERITSETFDTLYTDNMGEFYKACAFMLEVNFGNFFKGLNLGDTLAAAKTVAG